MQKLAPALIIILLTGCGDKTTNHARTETNTSESTISMVSTTPCDIVLTALDSTEQTIAITKYQQAVLKDQMLLPNLEKLGWAFIDKARSGFDTGYYRLAKLTAECINEKQADNAGALLLQGHVLHSLHQFREAEILARLLITTRGMWFEYGLLGDVLMEQGKLEAAAEAYQEMMNQRPGPQAYSRAAHLRWLKGDLSGAIEMMQSTVQAIGSRARESAAWAQVRLGLYIFQEGDYQNAQYEIDHALSLHKNYAPALLAQGRLYLAQNKSVAAIESLKQAVENNPLPEYQWTLIEALQADQQFEQARVIEDQLKNKGALEDRRTYALYLASTEQDVDTALQLASLELKTRQDVFSLDTMAWSLLANDRIAEALAFSIRATSEGTQDARLFFHAAVIAQAAGDAAKAMHWFTRAHSLAHMLLPSERQQLVNKFASIALQINPLVPGELPDQERFIF